ncbi:hypothetical protein [Hyphomicrobium sp.]|uniref:hypothetical protein n=1 Tax=Hyphomicrobium sp. TaxID=82 RepID=UPI0025BF2862|nr:hypothetical protein [Hyphomicrobium sp.]MCC7251479.1 hypothetical protein [Hyphomicrobium sp.]
MPSDYARRGRPRGSGLDDRGQLRRIVELLEADPNLKPTTAIKAIGISDPSTIRRLRDKLKTEMNGAPTGAHSGGYRGRSAELLDARREAVPAQGGATLGPAASGGLAQVVPATMSEAQLSWFTHWCALGLSAVSSTVEAQMAMMDDFLRVPQVASALRQQLLLNDVAKAFCPKRSDTRTTLH